MSAIGGCFAVAAAFRSASSARDAAKTAEDASRRNALRDVSSTATLIAHECIAIRSRVSELNSEYQTAEVFSGSTEHSALQSLSATTAELAKRTIAISADAELFTAGAKALLEAPPGEVDRVAVRMSEHLATTRTIREEIERKYITMFALNSEQRSRRLGGSLKP